MESDQTTPEPAGAPAGPQEQRPGAVIIDAAAMVGLALLAGVLAWRLSTGERSTPEATARTLCRTLAEGDVEALLADESLGFASRAETEVTARGNAAADRLLALHEDRPRRGKRIFDDRVARHRGIEERIVSAGRIAFAALDDDERYLVWVRMSRREWVFSRVFPGLPAQYREGIGDIALIDDPAAQEARARTLGLSALSDAEQRIVANVEANPGLASDPYIAPILRRRDQEGHRMLKEALDAYRNAAGALPQPPADDEERAAQAHREAELGRAVLTRDDIQFLDTFEPLPEGTELEPVYLAVGAEGMDEADMAAMAETPPEAVRSDRAAFVAREGRRAYAEFLTGTFRSCRPSIASVESSGWPPGGLFRSWRATVHLQWRTDPGVVFLDRDGTLERHEETETVPGGLLRPAWADRTPTWRDALAQDMLSDRSRVTASPCKRYLGTSLSLVLHRGDWKVVFPPLDDAPRPGLPDWLVRLDPLPNSPDAPAARSARLEW